MRAVRGTAQVALILAWLVFMIAGFRSNAMLRDVHYAPVSYCQSHPRDFQMVDMKGPACVGNGAAMKWRDNQQVLSTALAICAVLFVSLFADQWRSRRKTIP
jgi:hypothetical protein